MTDEKDKIKLLKEKLHITNFLFERAVKRNDSAEIQGRYFLQMKEAENELQKANEKSKQVGL